MNIHPLDTRVFRLETDTPANPAAGADLSWTPPSQSRVLILSVDLTIAVTNAGTTRQMYLHGNDGTSDFCWNPAQTNLPVNVTYLVNWGIGIYYWNVGTPARRSAPMSSHLYLQEGDTLNTTTTYMEALDQISNVIIRYAAWQCT